MKEVVFHLWQNKTKQEQILTRQRGETRIEKLAGQTYW